MVPVPTSLDGILANGWMTKPIGILQLLTMSLVQGMAYIVALMYRGLQLPVSTDYTCCDDAGISVTCPNQ